MKINENENRAKYLDIARELKKSCGTLRVMMIPIVVRALGTVPKGLVKSLEELEIRGQIKTIQITALLRLAKIQRNALKT